MNDNHPKKGRPKKIKDSNENDNVVHPPKKRGRKKKEKPVIEGTEPKQKKKRGRKAAIKYFSSSIRKQIPLTTVIENTDNYLLHIDVKDDIEEDNNSNINQQNNVKEDTEEEILNNLFQSLELNKDFEIDNYEMDDESILKNIIENNPITMGSWNCENEFNKCLSDNDYILINPCKELIIIHIHNIDTRKYKQNQIILFEYPVELGYLSDINDTL